jgi:hypothetical protein
LLGLAEHPLADAPIEMGANALDRVVDLALVDVQQPYVVAGQGGDLGDAASHLPGANHTDAADLGHW